MIKAQIFTMVPDSLLIKIQNFDTAKEVWDTVCARHESRALTVKSWHDTACTKWNVKMNQTSMCILKTSWACKNSFQAWMLDHQQWPHHINLGLLPKFVPETERYWSPEAEAASVYPIGDHEYHDLIMCMVCSALEESWDDNPNDSIITWMWLNISLPEEYSGSSDIEVYEMFVAGILWWLRLHGVLGVNYTETQVQLLGTWLKGNASEWFTRNIEHPGRPIKDWSLESVIEGLQKRCLNSLMHRQASNKFDTIEQWQKTVQELIQELTKYAAQMVQYPDNYSFRRWLIAILRPSFQKEVLHRGITVEFSSMQDILEKAKDIEDSSWYDIRSQMSLETAQQCVCK